VTFYIRNYNDAKDRPDMIALYRAAWHATYDAVDGPQVIAQLISDLLDGNPPEMFVLPEGDLALVACLGTDIVGGIRGHPRAGIVHLSGMYVHPERQNRGAGRALFAQLLTHYPPGSVLRADVRPTSNGALAFYASLGFQKVGASRSHVGGNLWADTITMQRVLMPR
jgi:ribosomal protein S18 acetylase RimI-like enzyme